MATVSDIMTHEVVQIGMDDTVRRVRHLFELHGFHHLVVMEGQRLIGIISDRDLLRNISPFLNKMGERVQDQALLDRRVHQIMSRQPIVADPDMPQATAALLMLDKDLSCLPVVNSSGRLLGMVTWRDMLRGLIVCECSRPRPNVPDAPSMQD